MIIFYYKHKRTSAYSFDNSFLQGCQQYIFKASYCTTGNAEILNLAPPIGTKVKVLSGSLVVTGL